MGRPGKTPKGMLHIRNWDRWQSYRGDRGQPPWIKLHRCLLRNPEWVSLTDAQRGQLISMWLLAADCTGHVPDNADCISKLCFFDSKLDLSVFIRKGFLDARVAPRRRQRDCSETETETETEAETEGVDAAQCRDVPPPDSPVVLRFPIVGNGSREWIFTEAHADQLDAAYPDLVIDDEARKALAWVHANPEKRKTAKGMPRFLNGWMARSQNRGGGRKS